jgi:hypothetical protein
MALNGLLYVFFFLQSKKSAVLKKSRTFLVACSKSGLFVLSREEKATG